MNILEGVYDLHVHTSPDVKKRKFTDLELCTAYREAGMGGAFFKNHCTSTVARSFLMSQIYSPLRIQGGVVLNTSVGGLNPDAVDACGKMGGAIVWMPTLDAADYLSYQRSKGVKKEKRGIMLLGEDGGLKPVVNTILSLIAQYRMVLGTGHLAHNSSLNVVRQARLCGVEKILITHVNHPACEMSQDEMAECKKLGAYFEVCYHPIVSKLNTWESAVDLIRFLGREHVVLTTDLGQDSLVEPVAGMRDFLETLVARGISRDELETMVIENPRKLMK